MGNKNIKKETKKPKKSTKKATDTIVRSAPAEVVSQPVLIEKAKKPK